MDPRYQFPRTGYFIPGRDGTEVWTFGNLCLPPFKQEARMLFKTYKTDNISLKGVIFEGKKAPAGRLVATASL